MAQVTAEQLPWPTPCEGWTVGEVMHHSLGVTRKFTAFASGTPSGDGRGFVACRDAAAAAWALTDMTRTCELPFGSFSATEAAGINLFDVLAHTWDIAAATGLALEGPDELWQAGLDAARVVIGRSRDPRHYGDEITVSPDAPAKARFLGFLGRIGR